MKYTLFLLLILLHSTMVTNCQDIKIKGKVLDFESNEPMISVNIYESNTINGTISDSSGRFQLILKKSRNLEIHYVGYYQLKIINVPADAEIDLSIIKMVRDYSRYINVEGSNDIKPDMKKYEKIKSELVQSYNLEYLGKHYQPLIQDNNIIIDFKKN